MTKFTRQWKEPNWKAVWDWTKKVGGVVITAVITPYVAEKYGPGWGAVVGTIGGATVHQARRFGDGKKKAE